MSHDRLCPAQQTVLANCACELIARVRKDECLRELEFLAFRSLTLHKEAAQA